MNRSLPCSTSQLKSCVVGSTRLFVSLLPGVIRDDICVISNKVRCDQFTTETFDKLTLSSTELVVMSWRSAKEVIEQFKKAANKNDTVAEERIIRDSESSGDGCDIQHCVWVELCGVALKHRCLPMAKLLLPPESISNNFEDIDTRIQLMNAAIESDFVEGVKFLYSKGVSLYVSSPRQSYWSAMVKCVELDKVEVLKYLLELKDLDKNHHQENTLMTCCDKLNIECLKILLNSELINTIDQQSHDLKYSSLHHCIGKTKYCVVGREPERIACVKLLVEAGADINLQDINGTTPIQLAAKLGMVRLVIYLAQIGANLYKEKAYCTLLHCLAGSCAKAYSYDECVQLYYVERGANLYLENKQGNLLHCLAERVQISDSYDECVQLLITKGVDINKLNSSYKTPLYLAACKGNEEMVKSLIKSNCDVNIKVGKNHESVLLGPIIRKEKTIAKILIRAGCDVNSPNKNGVTPLMKCLERGEILLVKILIGHGASVNAKDNDGTCVLGYLFHSCRDSSASDIVKMMIKAGADIHKCNNLLCRTIKRGYFKTALLLIEHGIEVNTVDTYGNSPLALSAEKGELNLVKMLAPQDIDINHQNRNGETALHKAIQASRNVTNFQNKEKIIKTLLLQKGINVNSTDIEGQTALSMAVTKQEISITEDLLRAGADVNHCDKRQQTSLMMAVNNKDTVMVDVLLKAGAHLKPRDHVGRNAIFYAGYVNSLPVLNLLLRYAHLRGEAVGIVDVPRGTTSLMLAAKMGSKAMVEQLLIVDCNINLQDHDGKTALMFAVDNQDETVLSLLLENGADYNICDNNGKTALIVAVEERKEIYCENLLKFGASVNHIDTNGRSALLMAVKMNNGTIVNSLLQAGADDNGGDTDGNIPVVIAVERYNGDIVNAGVDVNVSDNKGNTVLMIAVKLNNKNIVNSLLKAGADVNRRDENGKTALIQAPRNYYRSILECLLETGADVNLSDNYGKTALMVAARTCDRSILECLLKAGADVNRSDNNGQSALSAAVDNCNRSALECLLETGADVNRSDNYGKTALMVAARTCDRSILECLLKAGADVNKTDTDGRSAIHGIMVGGGRGRKWINCLKLLLINKCHVSLDTPGEDKTTLFQWLLNNDEEDLIWYLVAENCSLEGSNLSKVKDKFKFNDMLMLSKILFESGAKSRLELIIFLSVLNTSVLPPRYNPVLEESEDKQQLDEFRDFCKSRNLKSRCRREIRNCIGPGISSKISQVGLPKYLQDYVVMKDMIPEKYFTLVIDGQDDSNARTDNIAFNNRRPNYLPYQPRWMWTLNPYTTTRRTIYNPYYEPDHYY